MTFSAAFLSYSRGCMEKHPQPRPPPPLLEPSPPLLPSFSPNYPPKLKSTQSHNTTAKMVYTLTVHLYANENPESVRSLLLLGWWGKVGGVKLEMGRETDVLGVDSADQGEIDRGSEGV